MVVVLRVAMSVVDVVDMVVVGDGLVPAVGPMFVFMFVFGNRMLGLVSGVVTHVSTYALSVQDLEPPRKGGQWCLV